MPMINELTLAYKEHLYNQNEQRVAEQEKQYAYYVGTKDKVEDYLQEALEITYDSEDVSEMQFQYINLTKKMIDQMSVVYANPAARYLIDKKGNENKDATILYNSILPENINQIDKLNHRLAKLSNCSLTFVTVDKKKQLIKYVLNPIYKYQVEVDDDDIIGRVLYQKYYKEDGSFKDELYVVVWTEKEHYLLDEFGQKKQVKDNGKNKNPYEILPYAVLKMTDGENFYGEGQNDLINVNEQINLLLTKLVNSDIILGTEGTTLGINLHLNKKGIEENGQRKIRTGRKHPLNIDDVREDMLAPSLQHITTDPHILEIRDFIDWYIKYIASMKGLNPSAVLAQLKDTSDYQKIMDAVDQMEMRKDDLEVCRTYEKERFEITRKVWNVHAQEFGKALIPEELSLKVDFAEIEIHKTPADEQAEFEFELRYNLTTPAEFLMKRNPDLEIKEAQQIIDDNLKFNQKLQKKTGIFEQMLAAEAEKNKIKEPGPVKKI